MDPSYQGNSYLSEEEEEESCNLVIDEGVDESDASELRGVDSASTETQEPEADSSVSVKQPEKHTTADYLKIQDEEQTAGSKKHPIKSLEMVVSNILDRNFKTGQVSESASALKSPVMSEKPPQVSVVSNLMTTSSVVSQIKEEAPEENATLSAVKSPMLKTIKMEPANQSDGGPAMFPHVSKKQPSESAMSAAGVASPNPQASSAPPLPTVSYPQLAHFPFNAMLGSHAMQMTGLPVPSMAGQYPAVAPKSNAFGKPYGSPYDFTGLVAAPFGHGSYSKQKTSPVANKGISQFSQSPSLASFAKNISSQSNHLATTPFSRHSNQPVSLTTSKKYSAEDKENSPLDLTKKPESKPTEEPRRKAEKRLTGDAPIDLAPKRIKTEHSDMHSTPLKSTPLRPTPVSQPNWYSDCLSKLASSVNQKNGLDQKTSTSSAFKSFAPKTAKPSGSPALPIPGTLPQFGMFASPWGGITTGLGAMDPTTAMMSMMNPFMMGGALPGMFPTSGANTTLKETVRQEVKTLKTELEGICKKMDGNSSLSKLSAHFHYEVERLERERNQVIASLQIVEKDSISAYYDHQVYMLLCSVKAQLQLEKKTLEFGGKLKADYSDNLLTVPTGAVPRVTDKTSPYNDAAKITPPSSRLHNFSLDQGASPMHMSTPRSLSPGSEIGSNGSILKSPNGSSDSSNESGFLDSSDISPNDQGYGSAHKRRFLSSAAIHILSDWYSEHLDHPYPDEEDVEELAKKANVSECQVKKWMANKRVRSSNTLSFNGSIHPKKLQKLLQIKEASGTSETANNIPEAVPEPAVPSSVASQYGGLLNQVQVSNGQVTFTNGEKSIVIPHKPPRKQKAKRLLDPKAVEGMNTWFYDHIAYPYPTDDEKQKLADENQLSVAQVTCWFANKRNRSNNTRKMTPKMKKTEQQPTNFVNGHVMASPQLPMGFMTPPVMNNLNNLTVFSNLPAFPSMLPQPSH